MLPILKSRPELRCHARSRRSGWQRCGRLAVKGCRVCSSHGWHARRWGADAPNYQHGNRTQEAELKNKASHRLLRAIATVLKTSQYLTGHVDVKPVIDADRVSEAELNRFMQERMKHTDD